MGDHYYTTRAEALTTAPAQGYTYEGIAAYVLTEQIWGAVPLYELYHSSLVNHHYTTSLKERDGLTAEHGWSDAGIACYVHASRPEVNFGLAPLHHLYNHAQGDHFFTTEQKEVEGALSVGYVDSGIACFVFTSPLPRTTPLHRFYSSLEREEEDGGFFASFFRAVGQTIGGAVDAVTKFGRGVVNAIESTVGIAGDVVGAAFGVITSIPVIGRGIRQIQTLVSTARSGVDFVLEATLGLFGIRPEKQMKLRVVIQMTPDRGLARQVPIVDEDVVRKGLQFAIDVFKSAANVRIVPLGRFRYEDDTPSAEDDYIRYADGMSGNTRESLNVDCETAWRDDLWTTGPEFEAMMTEYCFDGGGRKVVGTGAPVCAFAVKTFKKPSNVGCSLGPLTDYVTVMFRREDGSATDHSTLAHELGHACSLPHFDGGNNLMNTNPDPANPAQRRSLTRTQITLLRASRHVTYL